MTEQVEGRIWYVGGSRGEYSDRTEWTVYWFENETDAQAYCIRCEQECRDAAQRWNRFENSQGGDYYKKQEDVDRFKQGLPDPYFDPSSYDAYDVSYGVGWVDRAPLAQREKTRG